MNTSIAMATTTIAAGKVNPEAVSKAMLTALNNQVQSQRRSTREG
jgi:hypothetical protein